MKFSKRTLNIYKRKLLGPEASFWAFVVFFVIVFFTGGGSRDDIQSLLLLRPLAVLFGAYALMVKAPAQWSGRLFPIHVVCILLVLMILQLIPLPPSIWTELPGRQVFADIASIAGIEQPWRPVSLSPSKTMNSLLSLSVPLAAMMLYLNLDREYRKRAVPVVIILCVASALWAIFQVIGSPRGPLYIYRITNFGTGVGLFANRNHQAVILASSIVMLGWYAASLKPSTKQAALKFYGSMITVLVFVPLIFVTGSRAGLILMIPALVLAILFVYFGDYLGERGRSKARSSRAKSNLLSDRRIILMVSVVAISGIAVSSVLLSRSAAFDRLLGGSDLEELRLQLLPTLFTMIKEYMPWGSGFGSFEHVYKIHEPQELLNPTYLNHAHNDWLQFVIEGGVPALLIAICTVLWFGKCFWTLTRKWNVYHQARNRGLMCLIVISFLMAASIGDYPLRVPSIMALFGVIVCVFGDSIRSVQRREIKQN